MAEGTCSKHFPKQFHSETTLGEDNYPTYRRRNDRRTVKVKGVELDNTWVVLHNVDLVVRYDAHINVKLCNQTRCIKCMFKYMCKGEGRVTCLIQENAVVNANTGEVSVAPIDVVERYLHCKYTSGSEATWRVLGFEIQLREPVVERLNFHLPNEQNIIFEDDDNIEGVLNRPSLGKTIFTEWMRANPLYAGTRELTFVEFPLKFAWDKSKKEWRSRK